MISKLIPLSILLLIASCTSTEATDPKPELVDVRQNKLTKFVLLAQSMVGEKSKDNDILLL